MSYFPFINFIYSTLYFTLSAIFQMVFWSVIYNNIYIAKTKRYFFFFWATNVIHVLFRYKKWTTFIIFIKYIKLLTSFTFVSRLQYYCYQIQNNYKTLKAHSHEATRRCFLKALMVKRGSFTHDHSHRLKVPHTVSVIALAAERGVVRNDTYF